MAYESTKVIKQIQINDQLFDINALYIQDTEGNGKTWSDITSLVTQAFEIKVFETLPTASAETQKIMALVREDGAESGTYVEYVTVKTGETYSWERIGTTKADLSDYAKKETAKDLTTSSTELTTGEASATGVAGTVTGNYDKADAQTGAAGAATVDLANGVASITAQALSVEGSYDKATSLTGSASLDAHAHTTTLASTTVNYVTGVDASKNIDAVTSVSGGTVSSTASVLAAVSEAASITSDGTISALTNVSFGAASTESLETNYTLTDTTFNNATVVASVTPASVKSSADFVTDITGFTGGEISTTEYNTDAIKSADFAVATADDTNKITYIEGITSTAASLSGNTSPMKTATVNNCVLSWTTEAVEVDGGETTATTKYAKISTAAASKSAVGFTPASLGTLNKTLAVTDVEGGIGTPTSVLGSVNVAASIAAGKTTDVMTGMGAMTLSSTTVNTGYTFTDAQYTTKAVVTGISAITTATATVIGGLSTNSFANVTGVTVNNGGAATIDASEFSIDHTATPITSAGTLAAFTASVAGNVTIADHTHSIGSTSTALSLTTNLTTVPHTHSIEGHTHTVSTHEHPNT